MDEENYITLTSLGLEIAMNMYERHTLLTEFFINLGVDEKTAQEDACKVEHDISEKTFKAIREHVSNKKS